MGSKPGAVARRATLVVSLFAMLGPANALPSRAGDGDLRIVREATAEDDAGNIVDLTNPEGRSRWDLTALEKRGERTRTLAIEGTAVALREDGAAAGTRWSDPAGGDAALRWLFPDRFRDRLVPGAREHLRLKASDARGERFYDVRVETVGIGWVHLPSGAREVALQRALVLRSEDGKRFEPQALVHRWVDPRAGVVAEIAGTPGLDGESRIAVSRVSYLEETLAGESLMKLYVDEIDEDPFERISYGWTIDNPESPGSNPFVRHVTPEQYATVGDLLAADAWDFSQNASGIERAAGAVELNELETCNRDDTDPSQSQCGYKVTAGRKLGRTDIDFDGPDLQENNRVSEPEERVSDYTIWLRAGAQNEGVDAFFGGGESRFCYDEGRTPVPLWQFVHQDAGGWFLQPGDFWEPEWADPGNPGFQCEQTLFNQWCGNDPSNPFSPPILYAKACTPSDGFAHAGTQTGEVVKGGVVTLPSGHTVNALVVRTVADFCVYSASTCRDGLFGNKLSESRTTVYLWQAPNLGTVAQLQSVQDPNTTTGWSELGDNDFRFGLFPPVTIVADNPTDTTIDVSWDPGNDTRRIDGYRVYWDVDSGGVSPYADMVEVTGAANTSTTLTDLTPGTTYYITVTSLSTYADPDRPDNPVTYESLVFPTQVSGDPDHVYPVEVQATTTGGCAVPTEEVVGLTVDKPAVPVNPGDLRFCWTPTTDPCATGYRVLGATSPEAPGNFTPVADVGLVDCFEGDPQGHLYFLVVGLGPGGEGPTGH